MDPSYETVVELQDLVWTMSVYVLHGALLFVQAALAAFLLATGTRALLRPGARALGALRIGLGFLLVAPLAVGAPMLVSFAAGVGALALLLSSGAPSGRFAGLLRGSAIAGAALVSAFMLWEREDNLVLGADLILSMNEWRQEELSWQLSKDPMSPKVGDLAPDFELQDPEGNVRVRLSDFRGKRPVALVFGSYT